MEKNQRFLVVFNGKNWEVYDRLACGDEPRVVFIGARSEVREKCMEMNNNWESDVEALANENDVIEDLEMGVA